jgi:hypothetical protein
MDADQNGFVLQVRAIKRRATNVLDEPNPFSGAAFVAAPPGRHRSRR